MAKRVTPLRAGRVKARPGADLWLKGQDKAFDAYPFHAISPDLKVKISGQARRMALRLDPKQRIVQLVVPKRANLRNAYHFAKENQDWIREKIEELPAPVALENGAVVPIFGRNRTIIICYNEALKYTDITLKKDEILVLTNKEDPSARIRRFLMDEVKNRIAALAETKADQIRRRIYDIQIRDTKSRWGSCSSDGKLSFSWRLIFAPPKAFDYVVAHEVAHLVHMDHSAAFWEVCESLCKDYDGGLAWMRDHGNELMRYA